MQRFFFPSTNSYGLKPLEFIAFIFFMAFTGGLILSGCGQDPPEGKILAKINDYHLTLNEFEQQLAGDMEMEPDFKLTPESKKKFLDQLIRKELLIQEAMRLKLDRREPFIRAIERYWQQTLIRDLIEMKGEEISKRVAISEAEIEARYKTMKAANANVLPLEEMRDEIVAQLKEEQKTQKLKEWIEELKNTATIEINNEVL